MDKLNNIFDDGHCLTESELSDYTAGKLTGAALHRVEKHLLDCEFCREALDGFREANNAAGIASMVDDLNRRIDMQVTKKPVMKRKRHYSFSRMAAVITLVLVSGLSVYYFINMRKNENLYAEHYVPYKKPAETPAAVPEKEVTPTTAPSEKQTQTKALSAKSDVPKEPVAEGTYKSVETQNAENKKALAEESKTTSTNVATDEVVQFNKREDASKDKANSDLEIVTMKTSKQPASKSEPAPAAAAPAAVEKNAKEMAPYRADESQLQRAPLQEAILHYEAGQYDLAYQGAEAFLKKNPKDAEALFYSGLSAMSLKKEKVAAERLKACIDTGAQQWKEEASWYLALAYVKLNKPGDAKPLLEFLANGNSIYSDDAGKMLKEMK